MINLKDAGAGGDWSLLAILLDAAARRQEAAGNQDFQKSLEVITFIIENCFNAKMYLAVSAVVEFVASNVQPLRDGIEVSRGLCSNNHH